MDFFFYIRIECIYHTNITHQICDEINFCFLFNISNHLQSQQKFFVANTLESTDTIRISARSDHTVMTCDPKI